MQKTMAFKEFMDILRQIEQSPYDPNAHTSLEKFPIHDLDPKLRQSTYKTMIKTLNFVFADIPERQYVARNNNFLSEAQANKYSRWEEQIYRNKQMAIAEDLMYCSVLYCYALLMNITGLDDNISSLTNKLIDMFTSFVKNPPSYLGKADKNKHVSNANKRDGMHRLYKQTIQKPAERPNKDPRNVLARLLIKVAAPDEDRELIRFTERLIMELMAGQITSPSNEILIEAYNGVKLQLNAMDLNNYPSIKKYKEQFLSFERKTLINKDETCSQLAKLTDAFTELPEVYSNILKKEHTAHFVDHPFGVEFIFHHFDENEQEMIAYLFGLNKKYEEENKLKSLRSKSNIQKWTLLTDEERKKIAEYISKLRNNPQTLRKYIRSTNQQEMDEYCYYLLAVLINHRQYQIFLKAQDLIDFCRNIDPMDMKKHANNIDKIEKYVNNAHKKLLDIQNNECYLDETIIKEKIIETYEEYQKEQESKKS